MDVYDPWADPAEVMHKYGIKILTEYPEGFRSLSEVVPERSRRVEGGYAAIILAVAHQKFMNNNLMEHKEQGCIIYDVKGILDNALIDGRL